MNQDMRKLKALAKNIEPFLRIGKNGVSSGVIEELKKLLKKHHLVKVKVLRAAPISDKEELKNTAYTLAKKTYSQLIEIIGNTFTLYRK